MDPFNTLLEVVLHHGDSSGYAAVDLSTVIAGGQQLVVESSCRASQNCQLASKPNLVMRHRSELRVS